MNTNNVSVGKYNLDLYIVAPARFEHERDGVTMGDNRPSFVDRDSAIKLAKEYNELYHKEMCVYKLVETYSTSSGYTE